MKMKGFAIVFIAMNCFGFAKIIKFYMALAAWKKVINNCKKIC